MASLLAFATLIILSYGQIAEETLFTTFPCGSYPQYQTFIVDKSSASPYTIFKVKTYPSSCLDDVHGAVNTPPWIWNCDPKNNDQQFKLVPFTTGNNVIIQAVSTGNTCLQLSSSNSYASITMQKCDTTNGLQAWNIQSDGTLITGTNSSLCLTVTPSVQEWTVDISDSSTSPFYYFWDKSVGSGHGALMLRDDWQAWMKQGVDNIGFKYVRGHGILDDDVGSVNGINDYSFVNIDKIYQHLLSINIKPYVELSFMPDVFASGTSTICHYKGNKTPPKDYNVWGNFIKQFVQHLVDQFGIDEVTQWYFEVWNEPFGKTFWSGTFEQYYELYNYTSLAIKSVSAKLQVGGPSLCCVNPSWLDGFLNYTFIHKLPIDFVSWHSYPNPKYSLASFVSDEIIPLQDVVKKYNNKYNVNLPVYISEWSSQCCAPKDGYDTEYNAAYLIYVAMFFQQTIYPKQDNSMIKWMSYWSISDVFEEAGFNSHEFNGLYGMQTIRGIPKPAFRAMELLNKFGGNISYATSITTQNNKDDTVIVYCLKNTNGNNRYSVFVSNFNGVDLPIQSYDVSIYVNNGYNMKLSKVTMYKIDGNNTNPIMAWKNMSSPLYPTQQQLQKINDTSQLKAMNSVNWKQLNSTTVQIDLNIPVYGVVLFDLQY